MKTDEGETEGRFWTGLTGLGKGSLGPFTFLLLPFTFLDRRAMKKAGEGKRLFCPLMSFMFLLSKIPLPCL